MNGLDDELVRELRSRSEDVGGHPIGMDSVRRTARRIVWRRRIAVGAAAAAVLAVAVPAGMAFTGGVDQGVGPIGRPTPTVTHAGPTPVSPTPTSPGPTTPTSTGQALPAGVVPLTTVGAPQGAAPGIVYLQGDTLHNGSTTLQLPGRYISITPYHGGWLAVEPRHAELVQLRQDSSGRVVQVGPPTKTLDAYAALAVNESGLVAWFESGGAGSPGQMVRAIATGMSDGQATVTIPPGAGSWSTRSTAGTRRCCSPTSPPGPPLGSSPARSGRPTPRRRSTASPRSPRSPTAARARR